MKEERGALVGPVKEGDVVIAAVRVGLDVEVLKKISVKNNFFLQDAPSGRIDGLT